MKRNRLIAIVMVLLSMLLPAQARTADGWEASWSIPLAFLRQFCPEAAFAGEWRANVYKCGDRTVRPHYLSWNPVASDTPDFHRPQDFGVLDFA